MAGGDHRSFFPWWLREIPADLAATITLVVVANVLVLAPVVRETPLRIVFGLPLVLFLPGYAVTAALFPETPRELPPATSEAGDSDMGRGRRFRGIDGIERVALGFGLSIAIVPLIGLVLNFTPWGIRLLPILAAVSGVTLLACIIAIQRRWALPPDDRFRVPYRDWLDATRRELFHPETRADLALNVLLAVSVLIAAASVTYAVAIPQQGEAFTELYLLTEQPNGELVADNYPTEYTLGEPRPLIIGIGNHEHATTDYAVVVTLQRVQLADNSTTIVTETELDRFRVTLDHNETWQERYNVRPTMTGTRLRLAFLLYKNDIPPAPTVDNAYREVHLWVNVTQSSGG